MVARVVARNTCMLQFHPTILVVPAQAGIQNLFCEVDKYSRLKHPEIAGLSGRTRIKQKFRENPEPIQYFYPPKWGVGQILIKKQQVIRNSNKTQDVGVNSDK